MQLESLQVAEAALGGKDHVGVLPAVVCAELGLCIGVTVARELRAAQAGLAGNDLGILALGADDRHVRRLVLHAQSMFQCLSQPCKRWRCCAFYLQAG